jgi:predicted nucleic acid-binding protein
VTIVVDASLTIAAFTEERATEAAQTVMAEVSRNGAWVPSLWKLEVANVLRVLVLRKRAAPTFVDDVLQALAAFPIVVDLETDSRAWRETLALSKDQNLTAYDAAYLELAIRRQARLATLDLELVSAARRLGVDVLPF